MWHLKTILGLHPTNERRRYKVTPLSLAGRIPKISPALQQAIMTQFLHHKGGDDAIVIETHFWR